MAITNKEEGVWGLDQVYNKINEGGIWTYTGSEKDLFGWGDNGSGQLGQNNRTTTSSPIQIPGSGFNLKSGQAYYDNSNMAITKTDGSLWVWGSNSNGSLGLNEASPGGSRSSPTQVGTDTTWAFAFTTYQNTYATKTDGTLWGWGGNGDGQLGLNASGDSERKSSPTQIGTGTDWSTADNCISGARGGVAALKSDNTMYSWGGNNSGMLGHSNQTKYSSPKQLPGTTWRSLGSGYNALWATKTDGSLWGWGGGGGALGQNQNTASYSSPKQVGTGTNWSTVVSGSYIAHTIATKTDGTLWTWGTNYGRGTLGLNVGGPSTAGDVSSPTQVGTDTDWANAVAAGRFSCVAIKTDGSMYSWGAGYYGMGGRNSTQMVSSPTQLPGTWSQVSPTAGANSGFYADKTYS